MSAESHIYYGFSLTEDYRKIQKELKSILGIEGYFSLQEYILENDAGQTYYDGGGLGQVTYVGKDIPVTDRGYVVTDALIEESETLIANLPSEFRQALAAFYGEVPAPTFQHEHSDG
jgi:hypothetical protein